MLGIAERELRNLYTHMLEGILHALGEAREDDNIDDFGPAISASGQAATQAIVILQDLFLRKQQELQSGRNLPNQQQRQQQQQQYQQPALQYNRVQLPRNRPEQQLSRHELPRNTNSNRSSNAPQPPAQDGRISYTIGQRSSPGMSPDIGTRRTSNTIPTTPSPDQPQSTRNSNMRPYPISRSSMSGDSRYSTETMYTAATSISNESTTSGAPPYRRNTISPYHGFCKYAHKLRDGDAAAMMLYNKNIASQRFDIGCRSCKCEFAEPAVKVGNTWQMSDRIRTAHDVKYRFKFLAKSHLPQKEQYETPDFQCIICMYLALESVTYAGVDDLMCHVSKHAGQPFDNILLEGPLVFGNVSIRAPTEGEKFDLEMPVSPPTPSSQAQRWLDTAPTNPTYVTQFTQRPANLWRPTARTFDVF